MDEIKASLQIWSRDNQEEIEMVFSQLSLENLYLKTEIQEDSLLGQETDEEEENSIPLWQTCLSGITPGLNQTQLESFLQQNFPFGYSIIEFTAEPIKNRSRLAALNQSTSAHANSNLRKEKIKKQKPTLQVLENFLPSWMKTLAETDQKILQADLYNAPSLLQRAAAAHSLYQIQAGSEKYREKQRQLSALKTEQTAIQTQLQQAEQTLKDAKKDPLVFYKTLLPYENLSEALNLFRKLLYIDAQKTFFESKRDHFQNLFYIRKVQSALAWFINYHQEYNIVDKSVSPDSLLVRKHQQALDALCLEIKKWLENLGFQNQDSLLEGNIHYAPRPLAVETIQTHFPNDKDPLLIQFYKQQLLYRQKKTKEEIDTIEKSILRINQKINTELKLVPQDLDQVKQYVEKFPRRRHAVFVEGNFEDGLMYASFSAQPKKEINVRYRTDIDWKKIREENPEKMQQLQNLLLALPKDEMGCLLKSWNSPFTEEGEFGGSAFSGGPFISPQAFRSNDRQQFRQDFRQYSQKYEPQAILLLPKYNNLFALLSDIFFDYYRENAILEREVWVEENKKCSHFLEAKVHPDQEEDILLKMQALGGSLQRHSMALPEYNTWADIQEGFAMHASYKEADITYVPYHVQATFSDSRAIWSLNVKKYKSQIRERLIEEYSSLQIDEKDMLALEFRGVKKIIHKEDFYSTGLFDLAKRYFPDFDSKACLEKISEMKWQDYQQLAKEKKAIGNFGR